MLQAPEVFTTERLVLRRPRLSDAEAIFEYASDSTVIHYMDYGSRTDVSEVVKSLESRPAEWESGSFSWVLTVKPDDRPIGTIGCWLEDHAAGFGYLLNQKYWGKGYATEAARTVVNWAISLPEIYRVWATCDTENLASVKVLEKSGLVCEGRLRCYLIRPNISAIPRDAFMYARVRGAS
ncbi:MAG: GNAT family N-acetyltransferase [Drouetiella hepatica Uher 2000/2452]|jgi:RimJ/RimL family protein N-acetyltransferase|uniref:GNAT family N-acetyltransferase n=1 Tax=Drouetiella hepatica Uher 2000/2452 TaxID=904376 RepID=A0A951UMW1_9CYAN|nr:GNAT family N-acetyltransferase [Drouetiella hepatica Uher 2000/2452]